MFIYIYIYHFIPSVGGFHLPFPFLVTWKPEKKAAEFHEWSPRGENPCGLQRLDGFPGGAHRMRGAE